MKPSSVAFLVTGTELTSGEIINRNSQIMAQTLTEQGISCGEHLIAADDLLSLRRALDYLTFHYSHIIMTGGLGPTSDDHTRSLLADYCQKPLDRDEASYQHLQSLLHARGKTMTAAHEQQSWFPKESVILQNRNGTANGFMLTTASGVKLYALPGPPGECLPMFEKLIPALIEASPKSQQVLRLRLLGAREGDVAPIVDSIVANYENCTSAFRVEVPYIHVKVYAPHQQDLSVLKTELQNTLQPYLNCPQNISASTAIKKLLCELHSNKKLLILDRATRGHLAALLCTPLTHAHISFSDEEDTWGPKITITGLKNYWQPNASPIEKYYLKIDWDPELYLAPAQIELMLLPHYALPYLLEWICWQIWLHWEKLTAQSSSLP